MGARSRLQLTGIFLLCAPEVLVEVVQQPPEELYRVPLLLQAELSPADSIDLLKEFMGTDLALE